MEVTQKDYYYLIASIKEYKPEMFESFSEQYKTPDSVSNFLRRQNHHYRFPQQRESRYPKKEYLDVYDYVDVEIKDVHVKQKMTTAEYMKDFVEYAYETKIMKQLKEKRHTEREEGLYYSSLKNPSERINAYYLNHGGSIRYIKNPSEAICLQAIRRHYENLYHIKKQTVKICKAAIKNNPHAIEYVKRQTKELCLMAINSSYSSWDLYCNNTENQGSAIQYIKNQTEEMCILALRQHPSNIDFIKKPTKEMYKLVAKLDGNLIEKIPKKYRTAAIYKLAFASGSTGKLLELIPQKYHIPEEHCAALVENNPFYLKYIKNQTKKMCINAVLQNNSVIEYVKKPDHDIYVAAIKGRWSSDHPKALYMSGTSTRNSDYFKNHVLKYLPNTLKYYKIIAKEMCTSSRSDTSYFKALPYEIFTTSVPVVQIYLEKRGYLNKDFKKEAITEKLILKAIGIDRFNIVCNYTGRNRYGQDVEKKNYRWPLTPMFNLKALKINGKFLQFIEAQTVELCLAAVTQNGMALKYVQEEYKTPEICERAVTQNGMALKYILKQEETICKQAVAQNGCALQFVTKQTPEIITTAINQNLKVLPEVYELAKTNQDLQQAILYADLEVMNQMI